MKWYQLLLIGVFGLATQAQAANIQLDGAGSTFIYPIFSQWAADYHAETGTRINYQSIGSGGGIRQITRGTVQFAASDAPMTSDELAQHDLVQFPMIMGGVIPTINLPGIKSNTLKLDGPTLAAIFSGQITHWDDKRIKAQNPSLDLPDQKITVVHRADASGTTWIFTNYLSKVSPAWASNIGNAKAVSWPVGMGAKGNEAVANYVSRIQGAIGYVELAYVLQNDMTAVLLKNQAGRYVPASLGTLKAAAANANWEDTPGLAVILTDQPGDDSWPITGATFVILHKPLSSDTNQAIRKFLDWSWRQGGDQAESLAYVPLPLSLVDIIEDRWSIGPDE